MRIALCSQEFSGIRGGGIGTYVAEAGKALTAAGHEVWLVTAAPDRSEQRALRRHPDFHRVLFVEDAPTPRDQVWFGLARRALWFAQLAHDVLQDSGVSFDYVEFPDYGAAGAVAVSEQRLLGSYGRGVVGVALHSPTHECWQHNRSLHVLPPSEREISVLEDDTIRHAQAVWSPSTRLRSMVASRLGLPEYFADVIRYPMTLPPVPPAGPAPRTRLSDLRFVFFGRIEPRKGVRQLVEAFSRMPELAIECIGRDGNTSPLGKSEVGYLESMRVPNVRFTPPLARAELLDRVREADVVVLPSPWDNWPNACVEAMAAGRVVIGGRDGGMAEMIEHGKSGFLVDGGNADDLVRVIRDELGTNLQRLDRIGAEAARRIRELCDPERYARSIEDMVERHRDRGRPPLVSTGRRLVSVVVPFYKEDLELVGEAVDSAIAQTHADLEILVVDDGSPRPDADAILDDLADRDPRVRVLRKSNGGLASARNHGIEHARGELLLWLDADNRLRPEYAAIGIDVLSRFPDAMGIVPRYRKFDGRTGQTRAIVQSLPFDRPLALFRNSLGDAGAMLRREVYDEHGLRYDSVVDMYCDWALWLDMAARGLRMELVPRVLYDYRVHERSMMEEQAWQTHLAAVGLLIERHLPVGDAAAERTMLINLVQGWGVGSLLAALGERPEYWEDPLRTSRQLQAEGLRYRLAESFGRIADAHPRLGAFGRRSLLALHRLHGRWKDWRRGDAHERAARERQDELARPSSTPCVAGAEVRDGKAVPLARPDRLRDDGPDQGEESSASHRTVPIRPPEHEVAPERRV